MQENATESKMSHRFHLTEVPRPSVDHTHVSSAAIGEGRDPGAAGERSKLGAWNHPQPIIGRALRKEKKSQSGY